MTSEERKQLYRSSKILLERHKIFLLLLTHTLQQRYVRSIYAIDTRDTTRASLTRRRYEKRVEDTAHIRSRYESYAIHTSRLRGMLTTTYVWRIKGMSYVSMAYLPHCFRMYDVCVTYVRRIGPATYMYLLRIFKCTHKNVAPRHMRSMSYVSRSMSYVCSRMYDVRVT